MIIQISFSHCPDISPSFLSTLPSPPLFSSLPFPTLSLPWLLTPLISPSFLCPLPTRLQAFKKPRALPRTQWGQLHSTPGLCLALGLPEPKLESEGAGDAKEESDPLHTLLMCGGHDQVISNGIRSKPERGRKTGAWKRMRRRRAAFCGRDKDV